jgi:hypothetical protein
MTAHLIIPLMLCGSQLVLRSRKSGGGGGGCFRDVTKHLEGRIWGDTATVKKMVWRKLWVEMNCSLNIQL